MLDTIVGDVVGSRFEWNNHKGKNFDFLTYLCELTDDSIMTLVVTKAILEYDGDLKILSKLTVSYMQRLGRLYPDSGYGNN